MGSCLVCKFFNCEESIFNELSYTKLFSVKFATEFSVICGAAKTGLPFRAENGI